MVGGHIRVCITGATGFIGSQLIERLQNIPDVEVIALSRSLSSHLCGGQKGNIIWRRCNGFSLSDVERATEGADVLVYLIHSMMPSTSLTQGSFESFDLLLADNFARAAKKNGIQKIIYLGGIIPDKDELSKHLKSRREVEIALSHYGNDVTALRAGLVIGANGSSFRILSRLSYRLPLSICPRWTDTKSQPIDVMDVMKSLEHCIFNYRQLMPIYDIGGPDIITYREMLLLAGEVQGKKRVAVGIPLLSPKFSKLWVRVITGASHQLVYPLIESLRHEMLVNPERHLKTNNPIGLRESLRRSLLAKDEGWVRAVVDYSAKIELRWLKNVTSIQRFKVPKDIDAEKVAKTYFDWVPWYLRPFIKAHVRNGIVEYRAFKKFPILLLRKSMSRRERDRVQYNVIGGWLAHRTPLNGRLEFRKVGSSDLLISLLDFRPSLPWFVYKYTQALVHLHFMGRFGRHLERQSQNRDRSLIESSLSPRLRGPLNN